MNSLSAYKTIKDLGIKIFRTNDIATILKISNKYASKLLKELCVENFIIHLRRDLWAIREQLDPLMLPDYLTAPMPSYISLQSALYYHGLIGQIPSVIYVISIARTRQYKTPSGVYSVHHINPELFEGFDIIGENEIHMAQPEKALFDFFYLKSSKNKLFYSLPEVEIPKDFSWNKLKKYVDKVDNKSRQVMILTLLKRYQQQ